MNGRLVEGDRLLQLMAEHPDTFGYREAYYEWLYALDTLPEDLLILDEREQNGELKQPDDIDRLLVLAATYGFPHPPDALDAHVLPWNGGGVYPVQYELRYREHDYYLRWRYGFSIDVDDATVWEGDLGVRDNEWTFCETNVFLAIVSDAILEGTSLAALVFPREQDIRDHPCYSAGRCPTFGLDRDFLLEHGLPDKGLRLACRDFARWWGLLEKSRWLRGRGPDPGDHPPGCGCGIPRLSCGVKDCEP